VYNGCEPGRPKFSPVFYLADLMTGYLGAAGTYLADLMTGYLGAAGTMTASSMLRRAIAAALRMLNATERKCGKNRMHDTAIAPREHESPCKKPGETPGIMVASAQTKRR
jgi:hypothetical protein